jgi:hypothetical protein
MKVYAHTSPARGLAALRAFTAKPPEAERCDLCKAVLAARHEHLVDPEARRLICACDPCAILFATSGETKYRRVPRDSFRLHDFALTDQAWHSLGIPIGLAFIFVSSSLNRAIAIYPSPAGPTETVVDDEAWQEIVADNRALSQLHPDVEALLVNRMNGAREYFLAPIDECYKLTGLVRQHWRGFSGGEEGAKEIARFFDELRERSYPEAPAYARSLV